MLQGIADFSKITPNCTGVPGEAASAIALLGTEGVLDLILVISTRSSESWLQRGLEVLEELEPSHHFCPISGAAAQHRRFLRHLIYLQSLLKTTYTEIRLILPRSIPGHFGGISTSKRVRSLSKGTHFSLSITFTQGLSQHSFFLVRIWSFLYLFFKFIFYISKVKRKDSFAVLQSCNTDLSWLKQRVRMEMLKMSEHCRKH